MTSRRLRFADRRCSVALTVLVSLAVVSCTATGEPNLQLASAAATNEAGATAADSAAPPATTTSAPANVAMNASGGAPLPDQVGYVPIGKPGETAAQEAIVNAEKPEQPQAAAAAEQPKAAAEAAQATAAKTEKPPVQQDTGFYLTAGTMPEKQEPAKKGFLASLFGSSPAKPAAPEKPKPIIASAATESKPEAKQAEEKAKPIISLESAQAKSKQVAMASASGDSDWALPGVRTTDLFEIKRKSGINDDSDVDIHEGDEDGSYEIASAAGLARLAPNGLLRQNDNVDVGCLKPSLVRVLKAVEQRYGKKMIVTSGYRDPDRNRRVGGAKKSLHMACAAADIQVPGVGKWELATFLRSMPGRGGVGTYCSTNSVHVDVGPERDWNWRCGRRG
ncbi:MAG: peptidase M15A [Methylobacterium sp. SCN 67-24]|nr:MAG: peptidase M15A [Methylobacterium sp. SCN 67-24]